MGTTTGNERKRHLDKNRSGLQECFQLSGTLLPLGNPQRSRGPRRRFPRRLVQQIVDENYSRHEMLSPHTTRYGNVTCVANLPARKRKKQRILTCDTIELNDLCHFFLMIHISHMPPAKKWGDTEIAERGRSVLVMRARYRSAGLTPHQRGWTDAG